MGSVCIFCKIINKEIKADILFENESLLAFKDINPQAPIHILIIPKEHIVNVAQLTEQHSDLAGRMILLGRSLAEKKGISESGFRLVLNCNRDGGQAVDHIHLHLLGGRAMLWPPG
ncbi:MAG: histidine triad nucleotide-binding protein [bacterium]